VSEACIAGHCQSPDVMTRRRIQQRSGYEISAAIHCELLQFFVRQRSTLVASADERDVIFVY